MKNMEKSSKTPETQEIIDNLPTPDVETIQKWLADDLGRARSLLQAIHEDKNILNLIAVHMHGKISNHNNRPKSNHDHGSDLID